MPSSITPEPSAPLTPERELDIRTRRGHIADAPWGSRGDGEGGNTVQAGAYITLDEGFASSGDVAHIVANTPEQNYRRATFIARAPRDIDDLLNEIDRLRAELHARPTRAAVLREAAQVADGLTEQYEDLDAMKAAGIIGPHTMAGEISTALRDKAEAAERGERS